MTKNAKFAASNINDNAMFSKDVYVRRRRTLAEKMKGESGVLLFIGNVESPAQYRDNCYKWRQDGNWLYFFGLSLIHI